MAMTHRFSATGLPVLNEVRAEHGLAPLKNWNDQVLGARAIYVMTAPELDFSSKAQLPANVHYVGPAFEPFETDWESPWPAENTDPLVLISFSTSYMNQGRSRNASSTPSRGCAVRALLTAGPALDTSQLRIPDNTYAVAFRPASNRPAACVARHHPCGMADGQRGARRWRSARLRPRWSRPAR